METKKRDRTHITRRDESIDVVVERSARASTLTGTIRFHRKVVSEFLSLPRDVAVYLPPGYEEGTARYPVLYLQDGQNLFDAATSTSGVEWGVDETAEKLIGAGTVEPVIIVAIYSTPLRISEYTPPWGENSGIGDRYAKFLLNELKPVIDAQYRTLPAREHTAIGGSSLGAVISLYVAAEHPDRFSRCAALSPAIWWQRDSFLERLVLPSIKVAVTVGTNEGRSELQWQHYLDGARGLRALLKRQDLPHQYREVEGGRHHESAWQEQFGDALTYLFGK